jgi:DNA modification methylase
MKEQIKAKAMAGEIAVYCAHDKIVETDSLVGNPRNPNKHPKEQIAALAKIIKYQGWRHPIVISNRSGFVVKGHGRLMAAKELKVEFVPVDYQDYESEASEYADLMADNKIQEFSELDIKMSVDILKDIKTSGDIELEMSAFTEDALNELLTKLNDDEVKEDDFNVDDALKETTISKQGDVWLLGRHRLICGDSTEAKTYEVLMDGKKANLVVTDPPYNIDIQGGTKDKLKIKNDSMPDKDFYDFLFKFYKCTYDAMDDGAAIYVFHADTEGINFRKALKDAGFHLSAVCIWVKNSLVLSRGDFHFRHEPVLYAWKPTGKHKWYADRKQDTIWEFDRPKRSENHPTTKPVPLVAYPIKNSSMTNCIVLDPFGGSGSTLIACEQTDRICHTIELDEKYADVIVKRYIEQVETEDSVLLLRDGEKIKYADVKKEGCELYDLP